MIFCFAFTDELHSIVYKSRGNYNYECESCSSEKKEDEHEYPHIFCYPDSEFNESE